ncbi:hypothetical protein R3P38DRAFT_2808800 [Favolaschia claudopus]|uniref:Uncharacterized protein n=1 Tax=Favolaschia claudopus TaxID=2862362 RepID=A0AAV9ZFE2_9AGAR
MSQMVPQTMAQIERLNGAGRMDYHWLNRTGSRNPNTPIEAIRNPARQDQSRDVKVGDNPRAQTLSFGKEIEEHTIQQGSVRVNNGKQQDIGELAAPSCPLERKGNQGHRSEGRDVLKQ